MKNDWTKVLGNLVANANKRNDNERLNDDQNKGCRNNFGSRVLQNENKNRQDCRSRNVVGGKTPHHSPSLRLSNLLTKHHAVHHAQRFSY